MLICLLLFGLHVQKLYADYAGYNAAGRNPEWHEAVYEPLPIPSARHKPNEYEKEPHSYWYENKPETYDGIIHTHIPSAEPPSQQNFITDPPGVGYNLPENDDNFKPSCDQSYGDANCGNNGPQVVSPTTNRPIGPPLSSTKFPYKSAHSSSSSSGEEIINETPTTTDSTNTRKIVSVHETELVLEDLAKPKKLPCCACCKEETNLIAKATAVQPTLRPASGHYVQPLSVGSGSYSVSQNVYPTSQYSYGRGSGCSSSYSPYSYGGASGCCQEQIPTCCAPQLPCCPRIEFPCCPQQPICCQPVQGCGVCRSRVLKQRRTKRFGCIPCAGRKKRDVMEEFHVRRKRLGCVPCLKRRKRQISQTRCLNCSPFTSHLLNRIKRSARNACAEKSSNRLTWRQMFGMNRNRRDTSKDSEYDSVLECDKSCCDYSKCIKSKPLKQ